MKQIWHILAVLGLSLVAGCAPDYSRYTDNRDDISYDITNPEGIVLGLISFGKNPKIAFSYLPFGACEGDLFYSKYDSGPRTYGAAVSCTNGDTGSFVVSENRKTEDTGEIIGKIGNTKIWLGYGREFCEARRC